MGIVSSSSSIVGSMMAARYYHREFRTNRRTSPPLFESCGLPPGAGPLRFWTAGFHLQLWLDYRRSSFLLLRSWPITPAGISPLPAFFLRLPSAIGPSLWLRQSGRRPHPGGFCGNFRGLHALLSPSGWSSMQPFPLLFSCGNAGYLIPPCVVDAPRMTSPHSMCSGTARLPDMSGS